MTSKAGNVTTTTQSQTAQAASVSQEFGDVSQYRELNAIGTGEAEQSNSLSISSVPACLGSCLLLCHFLSSVELTSDRHVSRPGQSSQSQNISMSVN